jgi:hypothetical protein
MEQRLEMFSFEAMSNDVLRIATEMVLTTAGPLARISLAVCNLRMVTSKQALPVADWVSV